MGCVIPIAPIGKRKWFAIRYEHDDSQHIVYIATQTFIKTLQSGTTFATDQHETQLKYGCCDHDYFHNALYNCEQQHIQNPYPHITATQVTEPVVRCHH